MSSIVLPCTKTSSAALPKSLGNIGLAILSKLVQSQATAGLGVTDFETSVHLNMGLGKKNHYRSNTIMEAFAQALGSIFCWQGLILIFAGSMLALLMGMLPGLSSTEAMLILLPFTFSMNLSDSMMLLNGAYASAFVGGAVTSIMFGIPGSSTTIATVLDGYPMRQKGKGLVAIGAANMSSMFAGLFSIVLVIVLLPLLGPVSLMFGPPEWFVFVLFGLIILSFAGEGTFPRAMMSAALGILAGTIGLSEVTGDARFSFDIAFLWGGIPIIPAFIGLLLRLLT